MQFLPWVFFLVDIFSLLFSVMFHLIINVASDVSAKANNNSKGILHEGISDHLRNLNKSDQFEALLTGCI